jgi:hypothetical protein
MSKIAEFTDELLDPLEQLFLDPMADGEPTDQHPNDWADENMKTVTIPTCGTHNGLFAVTGYISRSCPVCGGPRGENQPGFSFDGSRRICVTTWTNPCGHVDYYSTVRKEIIPISAPFHVVC